MIGEDEGCDILERTFGARGFQIIRNFPFREGAVAFEIDGWDPTARIGFEYLTAEAGDHDDLSRVEFEKLADKMRRGELHIFIIDEGEIETEQELVDAANAFIDDALVARARDVTSPTVTSPTVTVSMRAPASRGGDDDEKTLALSPRVVEAAARAASVASSMRTGAPVPSTTSPSAIAVIGEAVRAARAAAAKGTRASVKPSSSKVAKKAKPKATTKKAAKKTAKKAAKKTAKKAAKKTKKKAAKKTKKKAAKKTAKKAAKKTKKKTAKKTTKKAAKKTAKKTAKKRR